MIYRRSSGRRVNFAEQEGIESYGSGIIRLRGISIIGRSHEERRQTSQSVLQRNPGKSRKTINQKIGHHAQRVLPTERLEVKPPKICVILFPQSAFINPFEKPDAAPAVDDPTFSSCLLKSH